MSSLLTMHIMILLERFIFMPPILPPSTTPSPGIVSDFFIILDTVLGRDIDANSAKRFLQLIPSSLSSHVISTTCSDDFCGPPVSGTRDIAAVLTVLKLFLGHETASTELDHLLHLLPASVFTYIEDEICGSGGVRYCTLAIAATLVFILLIILIAKINRHLRRQVSQVSLETGPIITPNNLSLQNARSRDLSYNPIFAYETFDPRVSSTNAHTASPEDHIYDSSLEVYVAQLTSLAVSIKLTTACVVPGTRITTNSDIGSENLSIHEASCIKSDSLEISHTIPEFPNVESPPILINRSTGTLKMIYMIPCISVTSAMVADFKVLAASHHLKYFLPMCILFPSPLLYRSRCLMHAMKINYPSIASPIYFGPERPINASDAFNHTTPLGHISGATDIVGMQDVVRRAEGIIAASTCKPLHTHNVSVTSNLIFVPTTALVHPSMFVLDIRDDNEIAGGVIKPYAMLYSVSNVECELLPSMTNSEKRIFDYTVDSNTMPILRLTHERATLFEAPPPTAIQNLPVDDQIPITLHFQDDIVNTETALALWVPHGRISLFEPLSLPTKDDPIEPQGLVTLHLLDVLDDAYKDAEIKTVSLSQPTPSCELYSATNPLPLLAASNNSTLQTESFITNCNSTSTVPCRAIIIWTTNNRLELISHLTVDSAVEWVAFSISIHLKEFFSFSRVHPEQLPELDERDHPPMPHVLRNPKPLHPLVLAAFVRQVYAASEKGNLIRSHCWTVAPCQTITLRTMHGRLGHVSHILMDLALQHIAYSISSFFRELFLYSREHLMEQLAGLNEGGNRRFPLMLREPKPLPPLVVAMVVEQLYASLASMDLSLISSKKTPLKHKTDILESISQSLPKSLFPDQSRMATEVSTKLVTDRLGGPVLVSNRSPVVSTPKDTSSQVVPPHCSNTHREDPSPTVLPKDDALRRRIIPVGGFAAALAATCSQPTVQPLPLPQRTRPQPTYHVPWFTEPPAGRSHHQSADESPACSRRPSRPLPLASIEVVPKVVPDNLSVPSSDPLPVVSSSPTAQKDNGGQFVLQDSLNEPRQDVSPLTVSPKDNILRRRIKPVGGLAAALAATCSQPAVQPLPSPQRARDQPTYHVPWFPDPPSTVSHHQYGDDTPTRSQRLPRATHSSVEFRAAPSAYNGPKMTNREKYVGKGKWECGVSTGTFNRHTQHAATGMLSERDKIERREAREALRRAQEESACGKGA